MRSTTWKVEARVWLTFEREPMTEQEATDAVYALLTDAMHEVLDEEADASIEVMEAVADA